MLHLISFSLPRRMLISLLLFGCVFTWVHRLSAREVIGGIDRKVAQISLEATLVDATPTRGSVTLNFQVRNHMDRGGKWTFRFISSRDWRNDKRLISEREILVDAKSVKNVSWQIPVFPGTEIGNSYNQSLNVVVQGPGSSSYEQDLLYNSGRHYGGGTQSLLAVSQELQVTRNDWDYNEFENQLENNHREISVAGFDPAALPASASGLASIDVLMISEKEWEQLRAKHGLFFQWVAAGGNLILITDNPGGDRTIGLGSYLERKKDQPDRMVQTVINLDRVSQSLGNRNAYTRREWELLQAVPEIKRSFGGIMLMVIVIAALLGPINIWMSFRKRKSLQVIWTTPVISLVMSFLVGLGIIISDGFGGDGQRSLHVLLMPEYDMELLIQEQVSRTGVLLNDQFTLPENTEIYMVQSDRDRSERSLAFRELPGGGWSGDWFESRSIQAQVLRRGRSSRAEVQMIPGENPQVLSTVDATFSRLLVRDDNGGLWMARQVSPGRPASLSKVQKKEAEQLLNDLNTRSQAFIPGRSRRHSVENHKGWFYAETAENDLYLDTLTSVNWEDRPVWFMGPVKTEVTP